jgi:hypothetical protein
MAFAGERAPYPLPSDKPRLLRSHLQATPHGEDLGFPMLESSIAREIRKGLVKVGDAFLTCTKEEGCLFAPSGTDKYVAAYHGLEPAPLKLTVPNGSVEVSAMGTGTLVWENGEVTIGAIGLEGEPIIVG